MGKIYEHYETNAFIGGPAKEIAKAHNLKGTYNDKSMVQKGQSSKSPKSDSKKK